MAECTATKTVLRLPLVKDSDDECFTGIAMGIWSDGRVYEGMWRHGKVLGYGQLTWEDGGVYKGEFRDDEQHGHGKYAWPSGDTYEGEYRAGKMHCHGKYTWANGQMYEGEFREDKRHGHGKYTWPHGDIYEGEYRDGKRHSGKHTFCNGTVIYKGDYRDCRQHDGPVCRRVTEKATSDVTEGNANAAIAEVKAREPRLHTQDPLTVLYKLQNYSVEPSVDVFAEVFREDILSELESNVNCNRRSITTCTNDVAGTTQNRIQLTSSSGNLLRCVGPKLESLSECRRPFKRQRTMILGAQYIYETQC